MNAPVYLGIDLGTQSVRVLAVTEDGIVAASAAQPLKSMRSQERHEQEPELWWRAVALCCRSVMSTIGHNTEVKGLAVDATSGTILLMDDQLRALTPGLMYDDNRARDEATLVNAAAEPLFREWGYRMQPSWALNKLLWLAHSFKPIANVRLAHQNDFIHARLAGMRLASDSSHSLKSGFDLIRLQWPWPLMEQLQLEPSLFPPVVLPGKRIGCVNASGSEETGIPAGTPIFSGMTDGCAAQIASGATSVGSWNSVIGTTIVVKGVTRERLHDPLGVIYSHRSVDNLWLPGGASSTGAGLIASEFAPEDLDRLNAATLGQPPARIVVYPLAGEGERFPFAAPDARSFSLGQAASKQERFHAILQGIAFIERLAFDALRNIGAPTGGALTVSGGATRSDALNQIRADVLNREIAIPAVVEAAFGMAVLAAAQQSSIGEATRRMVHLERTIAPRLGFAAYRESYAALVHELAAREWLPPGLAHTALKGANT